MAILQIRQVFPIGSSLHVTNRIRLKPSTALGTSDTTLRTAVGTTFLCVNPFQRRTYLQLPHCENPRSICRGRPLSPSSFHSVNRPFNWRNQIKEWMMAVFATDRSTNTEFDELLKSLFYTRCIWYSKDIITLLVALTVILCLSYRENKGFTTCTLGTSA